VNVYRNCIDDVGCTPVSECPIPDFNAVYIGESEPQPNFLDTSGRWRRFDPTTGEAIIVCEPHPRVYCSENQTPETDNCFAPVCDGAYDRMCDPIPSRAEGTSRMPGGMTVANFPTYSDEYYDWNNINSRADVYPVIFDNIPDAENPDDLNGETQYNYDLIPTCPPERQIDYCRPIRRCQNGESPISCTAGGTRVSSAVDCSPMILDIDDWLSNYNLTLMDVPVRADLCTQSFDASINETVYTAPVVELRCLPIPECEDGELPYDTHPVINMECNGQTWTTGNENWVMPSCDPIRSCVDNQE